VAKPDRRTEPSRRAGAAKRAPTARKATKSAKAAKPKPAKRSTKPKATKTTKATKAKAAPRPPVPLRAPRLGPRRYAVVYEPEGPRVRLGVAWFVVLAAAVWLGPWALAAVYAGAAGWAAWQTVVAWREEGEGGDRWVAAVVAAALPVVALADTRLLGLAVLVLVAVVLVAAYLTHGLDAMLDVAGTTAMSALFVGLAGASVVVTARLEIGAAVVLLALVSAYEMGDFLVGSGASGAAEGPIGGAIALGVTAFAVVVLQVDPFDGVDAWGWAALAAVACPLGQLAASAILPRADARAPALRRLDSLLVLGPIWAVSIGLLADVGG
jgi:hypothetical protein